MVQIRVKSQGHQVTVPRMNPPAKAKAFVLRAIAQGMPFAEAMKLTGRSANTYSTWLHEEDFARAVADVRGREFTGRAKAPPFPEFCDKYLAAPLFWHQMQWFDLLEGRPPRDLHPSQTYEAGDSGFLLVNTPPEHSKTTTLSINYVTWRIVSDANCRVILVSKTQDRAKEFLYAIKSRLTHHRYKDMQKVFAPAGGWQADATVWTADKIYLGSERDSGEKDPTVQAIGIGQQVYGSRADLILVDDAITLQNAHEFEKQVRWLQQEVLTRLGPNGKLIVVGTRVDAQDLYRELRSPDRYPSGESPWTYLAQPAVLEYAEDHREWVTLWPRAQAPWDGAVAKQGSDGLYPRWDGKHLYRRRGLLNPRTWALAYQQEDVEEDATFPSALVRGAINGLRMPGVMRSDTPGHRPQGMSGLYVIAAMDPATAGDTATIIYAVDRKTKKRWVLNIAIKTKATPAYIRGIIKEWTPLYDVQEWRIEKNAFQSFLVQDEELNQWLASRGVLLREHFTGKNKWDADFGVASMAPLFEQQLIDLPSTKHHEAAKQLIEQLVVWSPETKAKTDAVMCMWFAEIRAREIVSAASLEDGPRAFIPNRFLTRRRASQQVVVNLNDLAVAGRM